tara:strand:+ start:1062 stop:2084 length:1023 start_codon:yes stop_codon:yes gene_type:complete
MIFYFIYLLLIILISLFLKRKGLLLNYSGDNHQSFSNKGNIPLSGGIFLIFPIIFFYSNDLILVSFFSIIFLIGFFSDRKILISPKRRFIIQVITILTFVIIADLKILSSRIDLFDIMLSNQVFAYFFSTFCLLILVNGSNFIDGLNGLLISYSLLVIYILSFLGLISDQIISDQNFDLILWLMLLVLFLNIFNILMIGDSGAYLLGLLLGFLIITSHTNNLDVSPYFYISIIWYPCFENLFSILRKLNKNSSPLNPDNKHLHQLVFFFIKKRLKLSVIFSNNLSSAILIFFNFLIIYICSLNPSSTIYQVKLIICSALLYISGYLILNKFYELNFKFKK